MGISKFDIHDFKFLDIIERGKNLERAKVGIVGIPFDGATRGRPGARFAPREIREKLYRYSTYCIDYGIDLANLSIKDFGDIDVGLESLQLVKNEIETYLMRILDKADIWIIMGGDHSITEPAIKSLSKKIKGKIGLIILDAHHDLRELPEGYVSSGMVVGNIIKTMSDKLDPRNIAQIGIRGFINSKYYVEKAREFGLLVYTARDVRNNGIKKILDEIIDNFEDVKGIYFSFDVDSVDIIYAPGVNAPSIGGLSPYDVFDAAYYLGRNEKVFAMDITEHAPPYDIAKITTDLAANAVLYFLAGITER